MAENDDDYPANCNGVQCLVAHTSNCELQFVVCGESYDVYLLQGVNWNRFQIVYFHIVCIETIQALDTCSYQ